jgi:hypothetical protein
MRGDCRFIAEVVFGREYPPSHNHLSYFHDHVGFGYYGAAPSNRGMLHPGVDDDASGTFALKKLGLMVATSGPSIRH